MNNDQVGDISSVLVIDDDSMFAALVTEFLSHNKLTVKWAASLELAKRALQQRSYDVILLDNYLPDGFGVELMSFIQAHEIDSPVIMITADADQDSMKNCFLQGVTDYLLKPINFDLLWQKMQRCYHSYVMGLQLNYQNQQLELLIDEKLQEENLARHVYKHLAQSANEVNPAIRTHLQSSKVFNGDFFICGQTPNGNHMLMLVDATGHGLAAAISVLPMVTTLKAMLSKGFSLAHVVHEINAKTFAEIPNDRFVACIGIEVDVQRQEMYFFNGGMPEIIILNSACEIVDSIKSDCLPLGILDEVEFSPTIHTRKIAPGQHLLFYSDGLVEQTSMQSEAFGKNEFKLAIEGCHDASQIMDQIMSAFAFHNANASIQDDVSLIYVNVDQLSMHDDIDKSAVQAAPEKGEINLSLDVSGDLLASTNLLGLVDEVLRSIKIATPLRQKAFTVFSELINNSLDHGILQLESELKNDFSGFAEYLEERESRLASLKCSDQIAINFRFQQPDNVLTFTVKDSGQGYLNNADASEQAELSGRGLTLVKQLCELVNVFPPGNKTSVTIK